jgi:hypothetical protein
MSTLRRLTSGLLALGFIALPTAAAAAEPTPAPTSGPACKAGSLKLTFPGDIAVADAPDTWAARTGRIQDVSGDYYSDLLLTIAIWPDQGSPGLTPRARFTGSNGMVVTPTLRRVNSPHAGWEAVRLKPPRVWPNSVTSGFKFELSFPPNSVVTTYSTKVTATSAQCDGTALGSGTGMRYGFMTSGPAASASAKPRPSASAKPSRKPSPTPEASEVSEEALPSAEETSPDTSQEPIVDQDLAAGDSDGGSPLPWMAGLGLTALVVAGGLLFWLRRTSYDEDD